MRRVIPSRLRKKALFSCDRCKSKKIACKRTIDGATGRYEDTRIPCIACNKKGVECTTTVKRKKRAMGPVENVGLHYQCLVSLTQGLFPDVDVNNIDVLIQLGLKLQIDMPSRFSPDASSTEDVYELGYAINSSLKKPKSNSKSESSFRSNKVMFGQARETQYIGPRGTASFFAFTSSRMKNSPELVSSFTDINDGIHDEEITGSSGQVPLLGSILKEIDMTSFPLMELDRTTTDRHIDVFFQRIFPYYRCFSQERFMELYAKIWDERRNRLTSGQICLVYLVKIMGYHYQDSEASYNENLLISRLVNVVRLSLAEFMLTPTVNGILCLYFLSVFFGKNKRRECGYLLITMASRQAVALGLNRQSMIERNADPELQEEMKRIWWAVFEQEIKQSNLLGRVSSISLDEVTVDLPMVKSPNDAFFVNATKLSRIIYFINREYSREWKDFDIGVKERSKTVALKLQFDRWLGECKPLFESEDPTMLDFKYRLILEHKYYLISALMPFILNLENNASIEDCHKFDVQMVVECIQHTFDCLKALVQADHAKLSNAFWSPHVMYAYECVLCLCTVYMWMSDNKCVQIKDTNGNVATIESVKQTMKEYREYNSQHLRRTKGSISKLSNDIEMVLSSFKFMDEGMANIDTELMDMRNLETSPFGLSDGAMDTKLDQFTPVFNIDDIFFGEVFMAEC